MLKGSKLKRMDRGPATNNVVPCQNSHFSKRRCREICHVSATRHCPYHPDRGEREQSVLNVLSAGEVVMKLLPSTILPVQRPAGHMYKNFYFVAIFSILDSYPKISREKRRTALSQMMRTEAVFLHCSTEVNKSASAWK
jgi:hypothetical protein